MVGGPRDSTHLMLSRATTLSPAALTFMLAGEGGVVTIQQVMCARCGKPLSPVWRDKCHHCGTPMQLARPAPPVPDLPALDTPTRCQSCSSLVTVFDPVCPSCRRPIDDAAFAYLLSADDRSRLARLTTGPGQPGARSKAIRFAGALLGAVTGGVADAAGQQWSRAQRRDDIEQAIRNSRR